MGHAEHESLPRQTRPRRRVIGIIGGLGPHAHVTFERHLLAAVAARCDQDYPPWIVSSIPQTPDRTRALLGDGPSPLPTLIESLDRIAGVADFAVIACNTAHAYLDELRTAARVPILSIVDVTADVIRRRLGAGATVGLLATTGTLQTRLYPTAAPDLVWIDPRDLPDGARVQAEGVMRPIYGPAGVDGGGIKAGERVDPVTGAAHGATLAAVAKQLVDAGAGCIVAGCTEIPLALSGDTLAGVPLFDPMRCAAEAAIEIASGHCPLPAVGGTTPPLGPTARTTPREDP